MKTEFVIIFVTCASKREAKAIAGLLLDKRLIACASIFSGVESLFWWRGKVEGARESMIILKTRRKNFSAIAREIKRVHSYDLPEIIAMPITAGSWEYLEWARKATR